MEESSFVENQILEDWFRLWDKVSFKNNKQTQFNIVQAGLSMGRWKKFYEQMEILKLLWKQHCHPPTSRSNPGHWAFCGVWVETESFQGEDRSGKSKLYDKREAGWWSSQGRGADWEMTAMLMIIVVVMIMRWDVSPNRTRAGRNELFETLIDVNDSE